MRGAEPAFVIIAGKNFSAASFSPLSSLRQACAKSVLISL
jgi:hypothetical protein